MANVTEFIHINLISSQNQTNQHCSAQVTKKASSPSWALGMDPSYKMHAFVESGN